MRKASDICFASLPQISRVEVVHLAQFKVQKKGIWLTARMEDAREAPCATLACATLEGEDAQNIARLWRELPADNKGIRCHHPHFGIRFYGRELLLLEASKCWKCHNIFGESNGIKVFGDFDAQRPKAQELLALLQQVWNEKEQL